MEDKNPFRIAYEQAREYFSDNSSMFAPRTGGSGLLSASTFMTTLNISPAPIKVHKDYHVTSMAVVVLMLIHNLTRNELIRQQPLATRPAELPSMENIGRYDFKANPNPTSSDIFYPYVTYLMERAQERGIDKSQEDIRRDSVDTCKRYIMMLKFDPLVQVLYST